MNRVTFTWSGALAACLLTLGIACSSDSGTETGTGGQGGNSSSSASSVGGSASGGASASGGSRSGGSSDSSSSAKGGSGGSGGVATGGSSSGGAMSSGGAATGGSTGSGGASASGGKAGSGGGTGGTSSGGRGGTGGSATTGGTTGNASGGTIDTGGNGGGRADGGPDGRPDGGAGADGGSNKFNPCPAGTACKIMPLGDSITEGCCGSTLGGYRIELFRQAVKDGKDITFVGNLSNGPATVENKTFPQKHEGHGGWTISQISGIADSTLSANKPNIVLLKIGTNDINGTGSSGAPNGLKNLINQITKDVPSALLVVSTIIPIKNEGTNQRVKTYNATIQPAVNDAAAQGKNVIFVDSYKAFESDLNKYMGDNLHPNQVGYELLGQTWYAAIKAYLP